MQTHAEEFTQLFSDEGLSARAYLLMQLSKLTLNDETIEALNNPEGKEFNSLDDFFADLDSD